MNLGQPNVDQMLRSMSYKQLREWEVFEQLEPFYTERSDWHAASIVGALVNIHRGKGKSAKATKEFLLKFGDVDVQQGQSVEEQVNAGKFWARYFNMVEDQREERKKAADERRQRRDNQREAGA